MGRKNIFCPVRDLGRFRFRAGVKGRFNSSFLAEILEKALKLSAPWIAARFESAGHEDFLHIFDN